MSYKNYIENCKNHIRYSRENNLKNIHIYQFLKNMNLEDNRIKIINHSINKGVYFSRVEVILNAIGKYIIIF